jgi:hypothetical protein
MIIENITYIGLFATVLILSIFSFIVKDIGFIRDNPVDFAIELLFISFLPALMMVFVFGRTRKVDSNKLVLWFVTLILKLMIFHILFQLSGLYSMAFPNTRA